MIIIVVSNTSVRFSFCLLWWSLLFLNVSSSSIPCVSLMPCDRNLNCRILAVEKEQLYFASNVLWVQLKYKEECKEDWGFRFQPQEVLLYLLFFLSHAFDAIQITIEFSSSSSCERERTSVASLLLLYPVLFMLHSFILIFMFNVHSLILSWTQWHTMCSIQETSLNRDFCNRTFWTMLRILLSNVKSGTLRLLHHDCEQHENPFIRSLVMFLQMYSTQKILLKQQSCSHEIEL